MADNLVIVESPAKAKTIAKFLGSDYIVRSSYGHVRDLAKNDRAIDIKNNFEPVYEIPEDKKSVIAELSKLVKKSKVVWLATDEDREGEAISWHLFESLGLKKSNTRRIVFHEITKNAIHDAIENPRSIDKHLVDAQQARRVLDRLVGFELSPILWKKIKPQLSAGRVQSVAVRLIVERERDIDAFKATPYYKVSGNFVFNEDTSPKWLKAELPEKIKTREEAEAFLQKSIGAAYTISNLEKKPGRKSPSAPFTTSTLQQEASRKIGFSVARTMMIAQKLYENGHITYMRTDSVNLSQLAINAARTEILKTYGEKYSDSHQYVTKSASAQEAHEAIRPTYFDQPSIDGDNDERRLYDLVYKRTIASQMSDAQLEKTIVTISSDKVEENFVATGEVILFDGFLAVYLESSDDESADEKDQNLLPPLTVGEKLRADLIEARERFTGPPARFTEASLVKKLEELGIGRPSTYAPTISTIQKRGYIVKEDREGRQRMYNLFTLKDNEVKVQQLSEITGAERSKLFPTDIGAVVNDFLVQNFKDVLDFNFTAYVEKEFDEIAEGKMEWHEMIAEFYKPFHKDVELTEKTAERASGERILGIDPKTGKTVSVRIGRFGPMVQLKMDENDEKPQFASLRQGQRLETITFEEALDLLKLPRSLGDFENAPLVVSIGKFGPYIKHGETFYSLPKTEDPYSISLQRTVEIIAEIRSKPDLMRNPRNLGQHENEDVIVSRGRFGPYVKFKSKFYSVPRSDDPFQIPLSRAIEIIEAKRKTEKEKIIRIFDENKEVKILNGRWGPYISFGKKNIRIPKNTDHQLLTYQDVVKLAGAETKEKKTKGKTKTERAGKKTDLGKPKRKRK